MRKFTRVIIQHLVDRAIDEFMKDETAPDVVSFNFKGHIVCASIVWSNVMSCFYVSDFSVIYPHSVMTYKVGEDFNLSLALCL